MNDEQYMDIALQEAQKALDNKLLPVGAILVVNGEIVGRAHKQDANSYHLDHAEIVLLRDYFTNKNLKRGENDIVLYTTLEPCMMCMGTILHLPISRVVYAAHDPYGGGAAIITSEHVPVRHKKYPLEIMAGVREMKAKDIFKKFIDINETEFYRNKENPLVKYFIT